MLDEGTCNLHQELQSVQYPCARAVAVWRLAIRLPLTSSPRDAAAPSHLPLDPSPFGRPTLAAAPGPPAASPPGSLLFIPFPPPWRNAASNPVQWPAMLALLPKAPSALAAHTQWPLLCLADLCRLVLFCSFARPHVSFLEASCSSLPILLLLPGLQGSRPAIWRTAGGLARLGRGGGLGAAVAS